jgi:hypothetical protein
VLTRLSNNQGTVAPAVQAVIRWMATHKPKGKNKQGRTWGVNQNNGRKKIGQL